MQSAETLKAEVQGQTQAINALRQDIARMELEKAQESEGNVAR